MYNNQDPLDKGHKFLLNKRNLISMATLVDALDQVVSVIGGIRKVITGWALLGPALRGRAHPCFLLGSSTRVAMGDRFSPSPIWPTSMILSFVGVKK